MFHSILHDILEIEGFLNDFQSCPKEGPPKIYMKTKAITVALQPSKISRNFRVTSNVSLRTRKETPAPDPSLPDRPNMNLKKYPWPIVHRTTSNPEFNYGLVLDKVSVMTWVLIFSAWIIKPDFQYQCIVLWFGNRHNNESSNAAPGLTEWFWAKESERMRAW